MTKTIEHVIRERKAHHAALVSLSTDPKADGLKLWRKLRRIEAKASKASEDYCNGLIDSDAINHAHGLALDAVIRVLGIKPDGLFINRDPRGYALKINPEQGTVPAGMHTDWGRYGILAPTID